MYIYSFCYLYSFLKVFLYFSLAVLIWMLTYLDLEPKCGFTVFTYLAYFYIQSYEVSHDVVIHRF